MWLTGLAAALFVMECGGSAAAFWRAGGALRGRRKRWQSHRTPTNERAMLFGAAFVFHAAAVVLAITIPGPSFLFLVPAVLVTMAALAKASDTTIAALAATGSAVVIFPMGLLLYEALGGPLMPVIAVLIALVAVWIAPLFRGAVAVTALALVCAVIALALPAYTTEKPRYERPAYKEPRVERTRSGNVIRVRSLEGPRDLRVEVSKRVVSVNGEPPAAPTRRKPRAVRWVVALNVEELVVVTE
jgi:hypothetical protein